MSGPEQHISLVVPLIAQAAFGFVMMQAVSDYPRITVTPWFLGRFARTGHRVCRAVASTAYLLIVAQALASLLAIVCVHLGTSWSDAAAANEAAIFVARWAGGVVFIHVAGMAWIVAHLVRGEQPKG